jgi:hypothetical protein
MYARLGDFLKKAGLLEDDDKLGDVDFAVKRLLKFCVSGKFGKVKVTATSFERLRELYLKLKETFRSLLNEEQREPLLVRIRNILKGIGCFREGTNYFKRQRIFKVIKAMIL